MPENCSPSDCPLALRVDALERANEQHSKTHAGMYDRIRELEKVSAVQKEQYQNILDKLNDVDEKIDGVGEKVDALEAKPAKRWDSIVDKTIWAVAAAVIAFLLARVGL